MCECDSVCVRSVDLDTAYRQQARESKGLSVLQPFALLLALGLKTFEGRPRAVGKLDAEGQWIWVCAGATLMPFPELAAAVHSQGVSLTDPTLLSFCGVSEVTGENYGACFKTGCCVGRVLFGARTVRSHTFPFARAGHDVIYPVLQSAVLPHEHFFPASGNTGNTIEVGGYRALLQALQ